MQSGVCFITNNHNGVNPRREIYGEWIFQIDENKFSLEWIFTLSEEVEKYIGRISFSIQDIVKGHSNDFLLFSYLFDFEPLGESKKILHGPKRSIFYLKLKTWLNEEEEKFLRSYNTMLSADKQRYQTKFLEIEKKIEQNIIEEREKIMHLLNDEKGHWGDLELF